MAFNETMRKVYAVLNKTGIQINSDDYDGIIVKCLKDSNTLDEGRTTNQTHIAITGKQVDIFPYVRADGYFECSFKDEDTDLKKYFVAQIPVYIYKANMEYLDPHSRTLTEDRKLVYTSIVRSRRNDAADQIQMSMINMDSKEFVSFRRLIHSGDYLIVLKRKKELLFDFFAVKSADERVNDASLADINNCFEKLPTNTMVKIDELTEETSKKDDIEELYNHNLFGIHIKNKNDALSEENPHICIGWSELGDLSRISSKEELAKLYDEKYPDAKKKSASINVGQIWKFIGEMKIGDYVLFPENDVFHIGRIDSDYFCETETRDEQDPDYINNRVVTWVMKNISRKTLTDSFRHSLGAAMSLWTLNDYKSAVIELVKGTYVKSDDIDDITDDSSIVYETSLHVPYEMNRIIFGAPGTGKSYTINKERESLIGQDNEADYERVTFHPDYSYANFVGTYKPVPGVKDENGTETITYKYVPGPFMRVLVKALRNARTDDPKPFLLIIEEINRANVAAVFGDVFQLLDRNEKNVSEYPIQVSEDMKKYLSEELNVDPEECSKIRIPDNMLIWATMNSADQGVYPMDTAFKRRWAFTYLGIDDCDKEIRGKNVVVGSKEQQRIEWNELRKAINEFLAVEKINEDKQLGPYFLSRDIVVPSDGSNEINSEKFCDAFKHKVLMYLFEDAGKQKRQSLFEGSKKGYNRYSKICEAFDEQDIGIFNRTIQTNISVQDLKTNGYELDENGAPKSEE